MCNLDSMYMLYIVLQVKPYIMDKESGILCVAVLCCTHHNFLGVLTSLVCTLSGHNAIACTPDG